MMFALDCSILFFCVKCGVYTKENTKVEASLEKKMYKKNVHSRAYNKAKLQAKKDGHDHETCLEMARDAAHKAVEDAQAAGLIAPDPEDVD